MHYCCAAVAAANNIPPSLMASTNNFPPHVMSFNGETIVLSKPCSNPSPGSWEAAYSNSSHAHQGNLPPGHCPNFHSHSSHHYCPPGTSTASNSPCAHSIVPVHSFSHHSISPNTQTSPAADAGVSSMEHHTNAYPQPHQHQQPHHQFTSEGTIFTKETQTEKAGES